MSPSYRPYQQESDFWQMRDFLRQVYLLNKRRAISWHVARLEYARWHVCLNCAEVTLDQVAHLWELDGQFVAMMMPDGGPGEAHLSVHPDFKTAVLESEMLDIAEEKLAVEQPDGKRKLVVWASEVDDLRQTLLKERGYALQPWPEHQWYRQLDEPVTAVPPAPGYTIRALGDGLELLERCYASGLGFHEGNIEVAVDNRSDPTWYRNIQTAPLYRRDLDLVAIAPDGAIAAFVTIWFDDVTRTAYFEPVATVPSHQRRGLARALLTEGLCRLQRMGAVSATVGGYSEAANGLYRSVMGDSCRDSCRDSCGDNCRDDCILYGAWLKEW